MFAGFHVLRKVWRQRNRPARDAVNKLWIHTGLKGISLSYKESTCHQIYSHKLFTQYLVDGFYFLPHLEICFLSSLMMFDCAKLALLKTLFQQSSPLIPLYAWVVQDYVHRAPFSVKKRLKPPLPFND